MAEPYLRTQNDLGTKILKGKANFKKSPKERLTFSYVESRLENLEAQWISFVETHQKIVSLMNTEDYLQTNYAKNYFYIEVEDEYLYYKTLLKENMNSLKIHVRNNEPLRSTTESRQVFVKLPEIALPTFSGDYSEWANYKDLFTSLIHNNCSLENVQRLHYLKSSLTGEAEGLVKSIPVTADNYKICWDRLVNRYDNRKAMANSIIRRLMTQKPLLQESTSAIRLLLDTTNECLQSLRNMGVNVESWDLILIYVISQKLDPESRAKWEIKLSEGKDELPKFKMLEDFLETRFRSLEYKLSDRSHVNSVGTSKSSQFTTNKEFSCLFCSDKHKLTHCKQFIGESVDVRRHFVQTQHLCFNCLSPEHSVYRCNISTTCRICKKRHHTLLHPEPPISVGKSRQNFANGKVVAVVTEAASPSREPESEFVADTEATESETLTSCFSKSCRTALLATVLVKATAQTNDESAIILRCLLDQGSEASFITESAVQLLGLKKFSDSVRISGLGGPISVHTKTSVKIKLNSLNNSQFSIDVHAHVLDKLTNLLPSKRVPINHSQMETFFHLKLADPRFNQPSGIDLLLGTEVYSKILMEGLIHSADGGLIAQNTKFGWILSGSVDGFVRNNNNQYSCHTLTFNKNIDDSLLKRFWELEAEPALPDKLLTDEEKACEELFACTTRRDELGRYVVRLPFKEKDPASKHGGSKTIARRRFLSLEKRLLGDPILQAEYSKVMKEYITMGHMELCTDKNAQEAVYLPHHAVVREDKDTTKVRVVFDASCKGWNGASLNRIVGPTLQPELRHLVMRWRRYPISLVADIMKMYRQVKVAAEDVNFQRIFWRDNPQDEIQDYRLLRVTFGTSSAPYLAIRALQQTAHDEGTAFPEAATRVITDFYVDDLMTGCHSVAEGIQIYKKMTDLLSRGGFPLQKWSSNNKMLQNIIGEGNNIETSSRPLELKTDEVMKILGLTWNKEADNFRIKVNLSFSVDTPVTKRKVISEIATLFDPLGWLSPTIIKAKVFIQTLWLAGIGWDDDLPPDLLAYWLYFRKDLPKLEAFVIPRWIHSSNDDQLLELHGFSDASNTAYAAVVYARIVDNANNIQVHLLTAKTRVAPIKQLSIPRLELCGAHLLAKLLNEVSNVLNIQKQNIHAWSDSTIVLAWLRSHPSRWKTFVANRVSEILTILDGNQWSHVSSEDNPADCASRGLQPTELIENQLWMHGPKYLNNLRVEYNNIYEKDSHLEEKKPKLNCHGTTKGVSDGCEELMLRFSSLRKLTRVISFCRRVLHWKKSEQQNNVNRLDKGLTSREINDSLFTCIKMCQNTHLHDEIENLMLNRRVNKKSIL